MIYIRNITKKAEEALRRSPVILLLGARQTGKTTLVKQISRSKNYHYVSFDDTRQLDIARKDPMGFIAELPKPVIFDEVQRVPELFLAIKHDVDQNRIPGRYILTGSANPLLIPKIGDSLAGRVEILMLYPLSQGEIIGNVDRFIDTIWQEEKLVKLSCLLTTRAQYYEKIMIGGYPLVQNMTPNDRALWFENYTMTILQKDIFDLAHIESISDIPRLLAIIGSHVGSLFNASEISRQSNIPLSTLKRYINLLETIFILFFQQPWSSNLIRRVVKSPKPYLVDYGLLAWLLMITPESAMIRQHTMGHLVENFVADELKKQLTWNDTRARLYHFRTSAGMEVDLVLERADGTIIGIEVKGTSNVTSADAKGLLYLKEHAKDKWHRGIILYMGDQIIPVSRSILAIPMSALWSFT